jgi:hypothetical protein
VRHCQATTGCDLCEFIGCENASVPVNHSVDGAGIWQNRCSYGEGSVLARPGYALCLPRRRASSSKRTLARQWSHRHSYWMQATVSRTLLVMAARCVWLMRNSPLGHKINFMDRHFPQLQRRPTPSRASGCTTGLDKARVHDCIGFEHRLRRGHMWVRICPHNTIITALDRRAWQPQTRAVLAPRSAPEPYVVSTPSDRQPAVRVAA